MKSSNQVREKLLKTINQMVGESELLEALQVDTAENDLALYIQPINYVLPLGHITATFGEAGAAFNFFLNTGNNGNVVSYTPEPSKRSNIEVFYSSPRTTQDFVTRMTGFLEFFNPPFGPFIPALEPQASLRGRVMAVLENNGIKTVRLPHTERFLLVPELPSGVTFTRGYDKKPHRPSGLPDLVAEYSKDGKVLFRIRRSPGSLTAWYEFPEAK